MTRTEELYKMRIEFRNKVSSMRIDLREMELNLESVEVQITEKENENEKK